MISIFFFLSDILKSRIIIVTSKNAQGPKWKFVSAQNNTKRVKDKDLVFKKKKLPIMLLPFSFSEIFLPSKSTRLCYLLMNAVFLLRA